MDRGLTRFVASLAVCLLLLGAGDALAEKPKRKKAPKIQDTFRYVPTPQGAARQTIGDITIEVKSVIQELYQYPEIYAFQQDDIDAAESVWKEWTADPKAKFPNLFVYPTDDDGNKWINILGHPGGEMALAAFLVKVENNTDHILNFSQDAKVYFKDALHEEPVPALASLDAIGTWLLAMEQDYDAHRKKGLLSLNYPFGLAPSLFRVRFGRQGMTTFVDKEVLPGFSAKGLLLFPSTLGKGAEVSHRIDVLFFGIPTKVDEAGEVTSRARATFHFEQVPVKLWFDEARRRWVEGDPPAPDGF